jgi:hypothetical protein
MNLTAWVESCYGENLPIVGLVTRKSLDTLKYRKILVLPQNTHNLTIIKRREIR